MYILFFLFTLVKQVSTEIDKKFQKKTWIYALSNIKMISYYRIPFIQWYISITLAIEFHCVHYPILLVSWLFCASIDMLTIKHRSKLRYKSDNKATCILLNAAKQYHMHDIPDCISSNLIRRKVLYGVFQNSYKCLSKGYWRHACITILLEGGLDF